MPSFSVSKLVNGPLLYDEILAVDGILELEDGLKIATPLRRRNASITLEIDPAYNQAAVQAAVTAVITAHVAMPGPGPVGMSAAEIEAAWTELGRKITIADSGLVLFRQDAVDFNTQLEDALAGGATQTQINRRFAWMVYDTARVLGMPMPPGYDPFDEATVVVNANGSLTWTPVGPPW